MKKIKIIPAKSMTVTLMLILFPREKENKISKMMKKIKKIKNKKIPNLSLVNSNDVLS